jgi:peptidoglycan/LPS O-acetylase OafA/YrhL
MSVFSAARSSYWRSDAASAVVSEQASPRDHSADRYQPQFDGLRALAVLTVMVDHFSADVPNFPLPDWIHLGATGVRLFLVLSGYFITASLRRARGRMEADGLSVGRVIRAFYWRRFLRISPAYVVYAVIALIFGLGTIRHNWPWVFTGTVNWLIASKNEWPPVISHLWSICVQEQFYLLWPLLILLFPRRWMLQIIIAVALAGVAFRIGCVVFSVPMIARWVLPFGSLDSLAAGAALGWCGGRLRPSRGGWLIAAICFSMLALAAIWRIGDPMRLRSVMVEPLEAGAFVVLVARTASGFSWLYCPFPDSSRTRLCRTGQLRTVHLSHPGCDALSALVATADAMAADDTVGAVDRTRHCYTCSRGCIVAATRTTREPLSWQKDPSDSGPFAERRSRSLPSLSDAA